MNREHAEMIAIKALGYVASDPQLFSRFSAISGVEAGQIRDAAQEPGFLAGVLQFILAHEPTVLAFAEAEQIDPAQLQNALAALPGGDNHYERSL